jgi:large subunit ribosomal protein L33
MPKGAENRIIIKLRSTESSYTYTTSKNKKNDQGRLELKKYDPMIRKHVLFKEAK